MEYFYRALIVSSTMYLLGIFTISLALEDGKSDLDFLVEDDAVTLLDEKVVHNDTILFAYCERNSKLWNFWRGIFTASLKCSVVVHKLPLNEKEVPIKKCNIELKGDNIRVFALEHLSDGKAIIQYHETKSRNEYFKIFLIDMNSCHNIWYEYLDDEYLGHLVTSRDGFDVVTSDYNICVINRLCLIRYDINGDNVGYPIRFPIKPRLGYQVSTLQTEGGRGYFVSREGLDWIELTHVDAFGAVVRSKGIRFNSMTDHDILTSDANGKYGVCLAIASDRYQCMQFDSDTRMMLNETISLSNNVTVLKVHNLADDGLILFTSECTETSEKRSCQSMNLIRMRENGKRDAMTLSTYQISCNLNDGNIHTVVLQDASEYCLYLACFVNLPPTMKVQFNKTCVHENHLRPNMDIALTTALSSEDQTFSTQSMFEGL